jgi:hypothetical protein
VAITRDLYAKLAVAAEDLQTEGDDSGLRVAAWIAFAIARNSNEIADPDTRIRLARTAGAAGETAGGCSLAVLATRSIDPVLREVGTDDLSVDVGELEELNAMRRRLNDRVTRHAI